MYYTHAGRSIGPGEIRDYTRVLREIDEERRELAAFASLCTPLQTGFGAELTRHKDHIHDLTEQEELMMIRTRYVDFEPHWRAHRRFQHFLNTADSRDELLFCTDWLRQHEAAEDARKSNQAALQAYFAEIDRMIATAQEKRAIHSALN